VVGREGFEPSTSWLKVCSVANVLPAPLHLMEFWKDAVGDNVCPRRLELGARVVCLHSPGACGLSHLPIRDIRTPPKERLQTDQVTTYLCAHDRPGPSTANPGRKYLSAQPAPRVHDDPSCQIL